MMIIQSIQGVECLDSRGIPTVGVAMTLSSGESTWVTVPSGASTGIHEATELRDGDHRYQGKGVQQALTHLQRIIAPHLQGQSFSSQHTLDQQLIALDGTANKSRLGANTLLAVSWAAAQCRALFENKPLYQSLVPDTQPLVMPVPFFNVINGGVHADNPLSVQEFMVVPHGVPSIEEAIRCGAEIYQALKALLRTQGLSVNVGDEGGFAPAVRSMDAVMTLLITAIEQAGYRVGEEVSLALDVASSECYREGNYHVDGQVYTPEAWIETLVAWCDQYPIVSIEDGCAEDDWSSWTQLTQQVGSRCQLVGDDLFVTHVDRLNQGIAGQIANAILIKPNQVGTVSETLHCIQQAQQANYGVMVSHRSGETADTSIVDLALATQAGQVKMGAPCRGERTVKYNRLLALAAENPQAEYFGSQLLRHSPT